MHKHRSAVLFARRAQAADDASRAGATRDVKDRGAFLRVLEAALVAAHKPFTLLLPAATTILALRETSRWLELLLDLHDDHLPRFAAYTAKVAIHVCRSYTFPALPRTPPKSPSMYVVDEIVVHVRC